MPRQTQAEREEEQTLYLRKKIFGSLLWFQVAEIALYGTNAEFFKRVWEYRERIPAHGRCRYKKLLEELINKCGDITLQKINFRFLSDYSLG